MRSLHFYIQLQLPDVGAVQDDVAAIHPQRFPIGARLAVEEAARHELLAVQQITHFRAASRRVIDRNLMNRVSIR